MNLEIKEFVFIWVALMTLLPAFFVAFSKNILYSAFALFFTFLGTAGLYLMINADFLAVVQVIIYIGGVLVLLIFAILLTRNIDQIYTTNKISLLRSVTAAIFAIMSSIGLFFLFHDRSWKSVLNDSNSQGTISKLGDLLLNKYLLPFEITSILLLAVLIGALVIANKSVRRGDNQ